MAEYGNEEQDRSRSAAMLVYILMLLAPLFGGVTAVIGVILAYVYRDDCPEWLAGHFLLQIRTFWIGFLYFGISVITMIILIGKLLILLAFIWYMVRIIRGIRALNHQRPYPNPSSWGI